MPRHRLSARIRRLGLRASWRAWLPVLLLPASMLTVGWGVNRVVENHALHREGAAAREALQLYAAALQRHIDRYRTLPSVLALDPELRAALAAPLDAAVQERLNRKLETVNGVTQSSTLTLIDRDGDSIAASNWRLPSSNVGHGYAFRPYFQHAVEHGSGRFYGVGATTGVPGLFLSEAVRGDDGALLGVVVIKLELQEIENQWQSGADTVLVSDDHDVIILANRSAWRYRVLRPLAPQEREDILRTRQYRDFSLVPIAQRPLRTLGDDGDLVRIDEPALADPVHARLWQTLLLPGEDWTLHLLRDPASAYATARVAGLAAAGAWAALVLLALFIHGRVRIAGIRQRSREELEQLVRQHAVALRTARDGVVEAARQATSGQTASLEHLPQGVSVIDKDLRLIAWNRRYTEYFRYPAELMQAGRPVEDLFRYNAERGLLGPGNVDEAIARRLEHLRAGTPYLHERERPDGTVLEIRGNPMPDGGFVTSYTDITAYKNAARELRTLTESLERRVAQRTQELEQAKAEAERANRYKTRFVAAAVHDLLQPLNAARMFVSALREGSHGPSRALADSVDSALTAQDEILDSLLDISRLESGALEVRRRALALDPLLESLARDFGVLAAPRGLRLKRVRTRAVVDSDEALLRRILQNFLSNALRYTQQGGILIGVRREGPDGVRVEVWDTGPGIPEEQHAAIFEEFRRLDSGGDPRERGAGLGLAIVERIARLLDHRISLRSWPGRGSVFAVSLPRATMPASTEAPRAAASTGDSRLRGRRVWCIDDDPLVREGTRALLQGWGCAFSAFASVGEAQAAAVAEPAPDLLLLDYRLGEQRGPEQLPALQALWPHAVPVILVTAERDEALRTQAREAGWGFLSKPIRPAALRALMTQLLLRGISGLP